MVKDDVRREETDEAIAQIRTEVAAAVKVIHRQLDRLQAALGIAVDGEEVGE